MSLIVEDGTGVALAESYISVTDADTYHASRGNTLWSTMQVSEKEQALRRATDYMQQVYRMDWKGTRTTITQNLDWPRIGVSIQDLGYGRFAYIVPYLSVPIEITHVNAEYALLAAAAPLLGVLSQQVLEKVVGPIHVKYDPNSPQQKRYPALTNTIKIYLTNSSPAVVRLVRS
jgi:hypothetical protein